MKKAFMLLAILFSFSTLSYSQDVIYMINGDSLISKITEINIENIKYKNYNNLEGPQYIISKEGVSKIVFKNGVEQIINNTKVVSLEETKVIIIEYINKYAYKYGNDNNYIANFVEDYLELTPTNSEGKPYSRFNKIYDFSGDCNFHMLSNRNNGISYINVEIHQINKTRLNEFKKEKKRMKLVILVEGHDNAKVLRDALIRYNGFFL